MSDGPSIITRLGYDGTSLQAGLAQARSDVANYKAQAVQIETELNQAKLALQTQYSAANRAASQQRIADLRTEMAQTTGTMASVSAAQKAALADHLADLRTQFAAEQQYLSSYDDTIAKVNELKAAYLSASSSAKEASAAVGLFKSQGAGPTVIGLLTDQLEQLTLIAPGLSGVTANISRLSQLLVGGSFSSGAAEAASGLEGAAVAGLSLGGIVAGLTAGFIALGAGAIYVGKGMIDEAQQITNVAAATGLTTKQVQVYNELAKEMGVDSVSLTQAFATLESQLGKYVISGSSAEGSTQQFVKVLTALGIPIADSANKLRPINDILGDFAAKTDQISDPTERAAVRLDALGARGKVLAELMNEATIQGRSFGEMVDDLSNKKFIISDTDIALLDQANVSIENLTVGAKGLFEEIKSGVLESIADLTNQKFGDAYKQAFADTLKSLPNEPVTSDTFINAVKARQTELLNPPRTGGAQAPNIVSPELLKAQQDYEKQIADSKERQVSASQQLLDAEQQLAALKSQEQSFGKGTSDSEKEDNLKQQGDLIQRIGQLSSEVNRQRQEDIKKVSDAEDKLNSAISDELAKYAEAANKGGPGPSISRDQTDASRVAGQINQLQTQRGSLTDATAITSNLQQQVDLVKQLGTLWVAIANAQNDQKKNLADIDAAIVKAQSESGAGALPFGIGAYKGPAAPSGALPIDQFKTQIENVTNSAAAGILNPNSEVQSLKDVQTGLQQEIDAREAIIASMQKTDPEYEKQIASLSEMVKLAGQLKDQIASVSKETPLGLLTGSFKDFSDIVGKFNTSFGQSTGKSVASVEELTKSFKSLQSLAAVTVGGVNQPISLQEAIKNIFSGGGTASKGDKTSGAIHGIEDVANLGASLFGFVENTLQGPGGAVGAIGGALSGAGAGALLGPIGAAIGAAAGGILGIFGSQKSQQNAQNQINDILKTTNTTMQQLATQQLDLKTAITQIQGQLTQVNAISGKGTANVKLQAQEQLENQIAQLQAQQQQILQTFSEQLSVLQTPTGSQSAVSALQQLAAALKQAADAGASAADQLQYFDDSVEAIQQNIGTTLQGDYQNVLSMLRQDIALQEQQQQIIQNANDQETAIRQSLGLQRAYTPAQEAALQIAQIEQNKNDQLALLQEQQNTLEAQLNGQAELFGWSVADLQNANAKATVIAQQLALEKQITAEQALQIQTQQQWYNSLLGGTIPSLPNGALPAGFVAPTGGTYTFAPGAVTIQINGTNTDPNALALQIQEAILSINNTRYQGAQ